MGVHAISKRWICAWLGLALFGSSCGYHFSVGGGRLPDGSRRLAIPVADNRTTETWAAAHVTSELRRAAIDAGLQPDAEQQDMKETYRLETRIESIASVPRGVSVMGGRFQTREQEIRVVLKLRLVSSDGKAQEMALRAGQSYLSAPDLRGTIANRQIAIRSALGRLARDAIERISKRFRK